MVEEKVEEKKLGPVPTTDAKNTILVEVPDEDFFCAFRLNLSDWESKEAFTCPTNMKTYKKEELKVAQTYENWGEE